MAESRKLKLFFALYMAASAILLILEARFDFSGWPEIIIALLILPAIGIGMVLFWPAVLFALFAVGGAIRRWLRE